MAEDIPRRVSIEAALNYLHDGTALTAFATYRDFDRATLDRLQVQLDKTGARVRGRIDGGRPEWIELMDYELACGKGYFPVLGEGKIRVIVALSRHEYLATEVKDHSAPVKRPDAVEPNYRLVVKNLEVETDALATSPPVLVPPDSSVDPFHTGGSGRPRARDYVVKEAERRIASGEVKPQRGGLEDFAKSLADWWEQERIKLRGPSMKRKSIENAIRRLWRAAIPNSSIEPPTKS
jgi:hypothetical protein